jgi:hypothetical protein
MSDVEIKNKMEYYKFGGAVVSVIEETFKASLSLPAADQEKFIGSLFQEYIKAGKPNKIKPWIAQKLERLFVSVKDPPFWVEDHPSWPWQNGKPMVFLGQLAVPGNEISRTHVAENSVIYVFGARVPTSTGWKMEYRVVDQRMDLKGILALTTSEQELHTRANTKLVKRNKG